VVAAEQEPKDSPCSKRLEAGKMSDLFTCISDTIAPQRRVLVGPNIEKEGLQIWSLSAGGLQL